MKQSLDLEKHRFMTTILLFFGKYTSGGETEKQKNAKEGSIHDYNSIVLEFGYTPVVQVERKNKETRNCIVFEQ